MKEKKRNRATKELNCHSGSKVHPDHSYSLPRLKRIQGQLSGIEGMIHERRYCADILIQFRAAMSALRNLEASVFETHLRHCVAEAMKSKNTGESDLKIKEVTELLARRTQV